MAYFMSKGGVIRANISIWWLKR